MSTNARAFPVSFYEKPLSGMGIQHVIGRDQPFTVWGNYIVLGFTSTLAEAYAMLQEYLDERAS